MSVALHRAAKNVHARCRSCGRPARRNRSIKSSRSLADNSKPRAEQAKKLPERGAWGNHADFVAAKQADKKCFHGMFMWLSRTLHGEKFSPMNLVRCLCCLFVATALSAGADVTNEVDGLLFSRRKISPRTFLRGVCTHGFSPTVLRASAAQVTCRRCRTMARTSTPIGSTPARNWIIR